jgi:hypothetical protein
VKDRPISKALNGLPAGSIPFASWRPVDTINVLTCADAIPATSISILGWGTGTDLSIVAEPASGALLLAGIGVSAPTAAIIGAGRTIPDTFRF